MKRKPWKPTAELIALPYTFESQKIQYAEIGKPGVTYEHYDEGMTNERGDIAEVPIDCWLWRDDEGILRGILNYYPQGSPIAIANPERPGDFMVIVEKGWQRRGIATALMDACRQRWDVNFRQQHYTYPGAYFVYKYVRKRHVWP